MTYSDSQITQVEKLASIFLPISDIAIVIEVPADVLRSDIANRNSDIGKAYLRGKTASKVQLLSQEMQLAQLSSPLAIENTHRSLLAMEDDE